MTVNINENHVHELRINKLWKRSSQHWTLLLDGFIWNQYNYQPPVDLLVQLVERYTGIAEVMGSNPVQAWIFLFITSIAWSAGVLLVRAAAKSSRSFVRPTIFDLQLEWTVGVGGGGGEKRRLPEEAVKMPYAPWLVALHCVSGSVVQLVERCTGFAEVMGSNPVRPEFLCSLLRRSLPYSIPYIYRH